MKKEYQYLIAGAVVSASVLLGMGIVGEEKQTTEGRYQLVPVSNFLPLSGSDRSFAVIDTQSGTVNYVSSASQTTVFPFAATKAE